jgi:hypothetical protein
MSQLNMYDLLHSPFLVIFASITLISVVRTIALYWHKVRQAELEASLKHEMLQRGMSADEIKTVLQASLTTGTNKKCWQSQTQRSEAGVAELKGCEGGPPR